MAKDKGQFPKLVEGYNQIIWENEDGTASYSGSLNVAEWERYLRDSGKDAAPSVEVPVQEPEADAEGSLEDKTVDELKDLLRERDLPVSGNKDELVARLSEDGAS